MQTNMSTVSQTHAGIYCVLGQDNSQMLQLNILNVPVFTKLQWNGWQNIVQIGGRSTLPTISLKNFSSSRSGKTFSHRHRHTSYYLFNSEKLSVYVSIIEIFSINANNGEDTLTKIKDSKINLAYNICDTLLLWFSMRCHIVNEVTLQKKILHYFS